MKYMGSKQRIAKELVPIIQTYLLESGANAYIEPFVGGANVIDKVIAPMRFGSDINPYLIALFQYLQQGGDLPEKTTREEYSKVRANKGGFPLWYVGCMGFLSSYNGRFFDGGYSGTVKTKAGTVRDYYGEARKNIIKQTQNLADVQFSCMDYKEVVVHNSVIYCDPPYYGVKNYIGKIDHIEFWEIMRQWSKSNIVLISEHNAPEDFKCIWEKEILRTVDNTKRVVAHERLFKYKKH